MKNDPAVLATPDYRRFIEARISAARHINRDLILLYWDIGKAIDEKQKIHNWRDAVVEMVARDLKDAFPGSTGFSPQNVWRMRQFYRDHTDEQFLSQLVREMVAAVPWGHHANALAKLSDPLARLWYLQATARLGWSRNVLLNQIKAGTYERAKTEKKTHNFEPPCRRIWPNRPTRCSRAPTTSNSSASAGRSRNGHWKTGSSNGCGTLSSSSATAFALSAANTG